MTIRRPGITHRDIVLVRPLEHALALIIAITAGLRFAGYGPIVAVLSPVVGALWAFLGLIAAALILAGLHWQRDPVVGRAIEQGGWYAAVVLLLIGPVAIAVTTPASLPLSTLLIGFIDEFIWGAASLARALFLRCEARAERKVYEAAVRRRKE